MDNQWFFDTPLVDPDKQIAKIAYDPETGYEIKTVEEKVEEITDTDNIDIDWNFEQYWY